MTKTKEITEKPKFVQLGDGTPENEGKITSGGEESTKEEGKGK